MIQASLQLSYDAYAKVWFATSAEVPGMTVEGATIEELLQRVSEIAPDLCAMNKVKLPEIITIQISFSRQMYDQSHHID